MGVLSSLGAGALLAWLALPVFAWLARPRAAADAKSLHRAQLTALGCAVAMIAVPAMPWLVPAQLLPEAPYYAFELHAIIEPLGGTGGFPNRAPATAVSPLVLLGAAWAIAVAVAAVRALGAAFTLHGWVARALPAPAALTAAVERRAADRAMRPPEVRVSDDCAIPFVTAPLRPKLVLPRELVTALDPAALELVIDHELEHLRRHHLWTAALATLLRIALGGHPVAERIAREALLAREIAIDACVSERNPRAYASLLVEIAAHAHFGERIATTAIDDTALARRIALITDPAPTRRLAVMPVYAAAAAAVLLAGYARTAVAWSAPPPLLAPLVRPPPPPPMDPHERIALAVHPGAPGLRFHGRRGVFHPAPEGSLPSLLATSPAVRACYARAPNVDRERSIHVRFMMRMDHERRITASVEARDAPELEPCLEEAARSVNSPELIPGTTVVVGLDLSPEFGR